MSNVSDILKDLVLPTRAHQHWLTSGIDCLFHCRDKTHFKHYPWPVAYEYNSRGFRDREWPQTIEEMRDCVWCVGDSFTLGIGCPIDHTWPRVVEQQTGVKTINMSMDGASNDWISRRAQQVQAIIKPRAMVVLWSYWHRRETDDRSQFDENRRCMAPYAESWQDDFLNFRQNFFQVNTGRCRIYNLLIPDAYDKSALAELWQNLRGPNWPHYLPNTINDISPDIQRELTEDFQTWDKIQQFFEIKQSVDIKLFLEHHAILEVPIKDRARDGYHFDLLTSQWISDRVTQWLGQ